MDEYALAWISTNQLFMSNKQVGGVKRISKYKPKPRKWESTKLVIRFGSL